jgi:hypothetical protein
LLGFGSSTATSKYAVLLLDQKGKSRVVDNKHSIAAIHVGSTDCRRGSPEIAISVSPEEHPDTLFFPAPSPSSLTADGAALHRSYISRDCLDDSISAARGEEK